MSATSEQLIRLIENGNVIAVTVDGTIRYKAVEFIRDDDLLILSTPAELEDELGKPVLQVNPWIVQLREARKRGEM